MQLHSVITALINARNSCVDGWTPATHPMRPVSFMHGWVPQRSWSQGWRYGGLMCGGGLWGMHGVLGVG